MKGLPPHILKELKRLYRSRFGLQVREVSLDGSIEAPKSQHTALNLPLLKRSRVDAMQESLRWGEAQTFFLAPGILGWIVPVVDKEELLGGLSGGEVIPEQEAADLQPAVNYLVEAGCPKNGVKRFLQSFPRYDQAAIRTAASFLFEQLYSQSDLVPHLITQQRERSSQQRQIAENIHERKNLPTQPYTYSYDEEQTLFSLIRVGDKPGARNLLNKLLAAMFLNSSNLIMVQARAIEMMGYLVRAAIEDSPILEKMLTYQTVWIQRLLAAPNFETLCWELREILDEFMNWIFLHGYNRSNKKAQAVLDYLAEHYTEKLSLQDLGRAVGLSHYRVAHLIKEATGKTVVQHLKLMRVRKAQELLLHTDMTYVDIAYSLGFSDQSYFIKQFREVSGTTPAKYRNGS